MPVCHWSKYLQKQYIIASGNKYFVNTNSANFQTWISLLMSTTICYSCRKDVRLPVQLQRAMAAEAEAAREARAKVWNLMKHNYKLTR